MKYYKFKHLKNITASISSSYHKDALIIGKNNVVICCLPREHVENSKSWKLIKKIKI